MNRLILALLTFIIIAPACAWASHGKPEDGIISSDSPWPPLPDWNELDEFTHGYFAQSLYERVRALTELEVRDIRYWSDGLSLRGMLIRPRNPGARKWPAIIFNRGGTGDYGRIGNYGVPCKQESDSCLYVVDLLLLAEKGFVVIASDYRFHGATGKRDQWGGQEVDDVLNLVPALKAMEFVDPARLYMLGQSRGGTMTYIALKRGAPVRAAAVIAGPSLLSPDTRSFIHGDWFLKGNEWFDGAQSVWPDYEHRAEEYYRERSAASWPEKINVPVLIMHSRTDKLVPVTQALRMADALQAHDKVYSLVIYGSDGHSLTRNAEDRTRHVVEWFDQYGAHDGVR
ncbi:MAG: prolyl oligopeptidase family serine peptidase [Proteobacteria bacterium]|nr:prolyl oligopeptidase family serine peptidase [Pseudomonadota bacterium]